MTRKNLDWLHRAVVTVPVRWLRFFMLAFQLLLYVSAEGQGPSSGSGPFATFLSFATNFPAVSDLVLEVSHDPTSPARVYQFRYQQNAFFGRELLSSKEHTETPNLSDRMCGYWEDDYWYYEPAGPQPTLSEYRYSMTNLNSRAYHAVRDFKNTLGWYQSLGYSGAGLDTLVWRSTHFEFIEKGLQRTITIRPANDTPQFAHTVIPREGNRTSNLGAELRYDTNVAPAGIPTRISVANLTLRVIRYNPSDPDRPLRKADFFPELIYAATNIARITHVKGQDFMIVNGRQLPMDVLPPTKPPPTFILLLLLFTLLLAPLLVRLRKQNKQRS